jgi:hypothetical protein
MKKIQVLILLFFAVGYSQDEISFRMQYQPKMVYDQVVMTSTHSKTIYLGVEKALEGLKDRGVKNPSIMDKKEFIKNRSKTGELKDNKFSFSCEFTDFPNKDVIPDGTTIYGYVEKGNKPVFDSIYSPKMLKLTKDMLFNSLKDIINQLTFPEKKMKIGESFVREMPLKIPIADKTLNMGNTILYKLVKIEDDLAYFDIEQIYTFDASQNDSDLVANGKGTGILIYDIKNTFYLTYKIDSDVYYEIGFKDLKLIIKSKTSYEQNTTITSNN